MIHALYLLFSAIRSLYWFVPALLNKLLPLSTPIMLYNEGRHFASLLHRTSWPATLRAPHCAGRST